MKSNRMFGILSILLDKKQVTAKELAEYFEVSVRTIHRDLLDLSSAGFPVITQQGVGGGISLMPNFRYNKSALSKDDMMLFLPEYKGFQSLTIVQRLKLYFPNLDLAATTKCYWKMILLLIFLHGTTIAQ